jgi:hypothetical protein
MHYGSYWEGRGERVLGAGVLDRSGSRADGWYGARVLLRDREICLFGQPWAAGCNGGALERD